MLALDQFKSSFQRNLTTPQLKQLAILGLKSVKPFVFLKVQNKKKYSFKLKKNKIGRIFIKNTLVNTYLSLTLDKNIVYAKSAGMLGFKKKQRRIKTAAYRLGKDLSFVLARLISERKLGEISFDVKGYSRYYRAIISSIRKTLKRKSTSSKFSWKSKKYVLNKKKKQFANKKLVISRERGLKMNRSDRIQNKIKNFIRLKDNVLDNLFPKSKKSKKSKIIFSKLKEKGFIKGINVLVFLRKVYDRTSLPHGGIKMSKYSRNNRYW